MVVLFFDLSIFGLLMKMIFFKKKSHDLGEIATSNFSFIRAIVSFIIYFNLSGISIFLEKILISSWLFKYFFF